MEHERFIRILNIILIIPLTCLIGGTFMFIFLRKNIHWIKKDRSDCTLLECIYFHFTTLSTVGYGDMTPNSTLAKFYTMVLTMIVFIEVGTLTVLPIEPKHTPTLLKTQIDTLINTLNIYNAHNIQ